MSLHPSELLHDYADGELSRQMEIEVEEHLRGCQACRRAVAGIRRLRVAASRLPKEIPARHDLWPGIAARLAPSARGHRRPTPWAHPLLAAAVLVIVVTGVLLRHQLRVEPAPGVAGKAEINAVFATFDATDREASAAAETVMSALGGHQGTPAAQAAKALAKNLRVVDAAIRTLREALQSDPGDFGVVRQLRREYQHKTALILQTARLADQLESVLPGALT
jgi:anti-sigma factor RsiW